MRINRNTAISTPQVLLVPYRKHHVSTYYGWMGDEEIRELTASDRLSLEEEYAMQRKWEEDSDKLTFIICKPLSDSEAGEVVVGTDDAPSRMIGDVNLFLYLEDDTPSRVLSGEIEIMIADTVEHGKGYGRAAVKAFLSYVDAAREEIIGKYDDAHAKQEASETALSYLKVKPLARNAASIKLFESLGFCKVSETTNVFSEFELRRTVHSDLDAVEGMKRLVYSD